jgi:hypothetical protein
MKFFRVFILSVFGLFLSLHLLFTLLYVLPGNIIPLSLKQKASGYINPLFNQGWALFAPTPAVNKKVLVSYLQENKQWSNWQDPFKNYSAEHQLHRFTANGKIILMKSSTLHYLYFENQDRFDRGKIIWGDTTSGYYKVLKHEVTQELCGQHTSFTKIKLLIEYTSADCDKRQTHYLYYTD